MTITLMTMTKILFAFPVLPLPAPMLQEIKKLLTRGVLFQGYLVEQEHDRDDSLTNPRTLLEFCPKPIPFLILMSALP